MRRLDDLAARGDAEANEIGEKAASLVLLRRHGFPVPDGLCITTAAFDAAVAANGCEDLVARARRGDASEAGRARAREAVARLKLPAELESALAAFLAERPGAAFAVRSSGTCEDLAEASFAGLYRSELGARTLSDVTRAIHSCWSAAFDERVFRYCVDRGVDPARVALALLVQPLVEADKSGVLFSVDPVRGHDTVMLIEAAFGLGEALVGGEVSPDRYRFDWMRGEACERSVARKELALVADARAAGTRRLALGPERRDAPVLTPDEVRELVELGARAQEAWGRPLDLEWAHADGTFTLLQCRPITRIEFGGVEGEWSTADFRDGGVSSEVCPPFMASLYRSVFDATLPRYLDGLGLRGARPDAWTRVFFARPYWNLEATRARMRRLPGYSDASFDEGMGIRGDAAGGAPPTRLTPRTLITGLRAQLALRRSCRARLRGCPEFAAAQRRQLRALDALDPDALPAPELYALLERFLRDEYTRMESAYFELIYDNTNLTGQFREAFHKSRSQVAYPLLLAGLRDVAHLAPSLALFDLSRRIRAETAARRFWLEREVPELVAAWRRGETAHHLDAFARIVERFRHHATRELDLRVPRFDEDPSFLVESLRTAIGQDDAGDPRRQGEAQRALYSDARQRFLSGLPRLARRGMARRLDEVRRFLWWREELRDLSTQFYYHVRRLARAVGRRLCAAGALRAADDVFLLPMSDLLDACAGRLDPDALDTRVRRNRRYLQSFRNYESPNEIGVGRSAGGPPDAGAATGAVLAGVPCSAGRARGRARVIRDIFDADRLEPGDILITRCTDPGWTPRFGLLAGVATETGGLLSHAAVISREFGIPAVLAVPRLTSRVRDGEWVVIDGGAGTVTLERA